MSDLAKYFLALAVVGTGFYVAQKYRRPELQPKTTAANSKAEIAVGTPRDGSGLPSVIPPVRCQLRRWPTLIASRCWVLIETKHGPSSRIRTQPLLPNSPSSEAKRWHGLPEVQTGQGSQPEHDPNGHWETGKCKILAEKALGKENGKSQFGDKHEGSGQ